MTYKQEGKIYTLPIKPTNFGGEELIWDDYTIDGDMFWYMSNWVTCTPNTEFTCPECGKILFCLNDFYWTNLWKQGAKLCREYYEGSSIPVHLKQLYGQEFMFEASCDCGWKHGVNIWSCSG